MGQTGYNCKISVIIPVLYEYESINVTIKHLQEKGIEDFGEIIVVDGDPEKSTINCIEDENVIRINGPKGRASQMNFGAKNAQGQILVFLHADTKLPENAFDKIRQTIEKGCFVAGAFDLGIDSEKRILKYIALQANMRSRLNRIPYGDQAIFIQKNYFDEIGGYKEIPIMEDVDLMQRIKKAKKKIHILKDKVLTSPRRWESEGALFTTFRNQLLITLYYFGVSPEKLVRFYKIRGNRKFKQNLIVFIKAPVTSKVKTRLSFETGDEFACELYKCFVTDILAMLKKDFDIYFYPAEKKDVIIQWLGNSYNYFAQKGGDLGQRMANAFIESFKKYEKAVIIGSDSPDMPAKFINDAFEALNIYDAVVGPSEDGGYYLIGFKREGFIQQAFENISWGNKTVLTQTKDVLNKYKKKIKILPMWYDIDTLKDLRNLIERNKGTPFYNSRTMEFLQQNSIWSKTNA